MGVGTRVRLHMCVRPDCAAGRCEFSDFCYLPPNPTTAALAITLQGSPLSQAMPHLYVAWLPPGTQLPHPQHLAVPLYATPDRVNVLAEVQLPVATVEEVEVWTLAGVALVLPSG